MLPAIRQYALVILGTVGLFALLFGVTASAYLYNVRFDLSPGSRFTLSDHALSVLRGLDQPIRITGFIRTEDPRNVVLKDLLWQAARESGQISYTVVDVNRNPELARQHGVDSYGSSVVESGARRAGFTIPSERQLMSAILNVTQPAKRVYVVTGHGECEIKNTDRHEGCSGMRGAVTSEFYEMEELGLFGLEALPEDADVVMIPGPRSDFSARELEVLGEYVDRGGKVFLMLDPFVAPRLVAWLRRYGIEAGDNVVIDPQNRLGGGELFSAVAGELNGRHLISSKLQGVPLFSGTRGLAARGDEDAGRYEAWLLKSGPQSWASHDPQVLQGRPARFVAGRDINGPLILGLEVVFPARAAPEGTRARIIVLGDSDFATNRFLDYTVNRDLLLNSINWLAREEALIAARPSPKVSGKNWFFPTQAELSRIFLAAVVVQPGTFIVLGLLLFVWRRLRP